MLPCVSIGIFCIKSKIVCVRSSAVGSQNCAIWTPLSGRDKGKLCFVKRKGKYFVSNNRTFAKENILIFRNCGVGSKNLWTFSRITTCFAKNPALFWGKQSSLFRMLTSCPFPHAQGHVRTDTPPRIAHSASSHFLPSPFTFTPNSLLFIGLRVKFLDFLVLHR